MIHARTHARTHAHGANYNLPPASRAGDNKREGPAQVNEKKWDEVLKLGGTSLVMALGNRQMNRTAAEMLPAFDERGRIPPLV